MAEIPSQTKPVTQTADVPAGVAVTPANSAPVMLSNTSSEE